MWSERSSLEAATMIKLIDDYHFLNSILCVCISSTVVEATRSRSWACRVLPSEWTQMLRIWVTPAVLLAKKAHFSFLQVSLSPLADLAEFSSSGCVSFEEGR